MNPTVQLIRSIVRELRHATNEPKIKDNKMVRYIMEQAKSHRETSEVLCKAQAELKYIAESYLTYLQSLRKYQEIRTTYSGKGERSVKETADLVGFKLPHDPK